MSPVRTASFSRQYPAPWLKLDKFLLSLLTEDCEVTAGPPFAPSKAIHTKKDFNPLQRDLAPPPSWPEPGGQQPASQKQLSLTPGAQGCVGRWELSGAEMNQLGLSSWKVRDGPWAGRELISW